MASEQKAESQDLESQPLTGPGDSAKAPQYSSTTNIFGDAPRRKSRMEVFMTPTDVEDPMRYHAQDLASWRSLMFTSKTVWQRTTLWCTAGLLVVVSLIVALLVVFLVTDPGKLKNHRFQKLSQFLNIFVGLLLGFFMSASVTKWWSCAEGFLAMFDCIRCLQIQLLALGVPESDVNQIARFGVLSCWILQMELHAEAVPAAERVVRKAEILTTLMASNLQRNPKYILLEKEKLAIENLNDKPAQLWVWVFSYISKLSEDGVVPAMATPTYNRLMSLAQQAFDSMREVRTSITLQAPYIYVQMLATLVHTNNLINAISFGLTLGVTIGTNLAYFRFGWDKSVKATSGQASRDIQDCIISFFFSCFGPFIYQALLEVSIAIAQPFSSEDAEIPTTRLIRQLETDLDQSEEMAVKISWQAPRFKK